MTVRAATSAYKSAAIDRSRAQRIESCATKCLYSIRCQFLEQRISPCVALPLCLIHTRISDLAAAPDYLNDRRTILGGGIRPSSTGRKAPNRPPAFRPLHRILTIMRRLGIGRRYLTCAQSLLPIASELVFALCLGIESFFIVAETCICGADRYTAPLTTPHPSITFLHRIQVRIQI